MKLYGKEIDKVEFFRRAKLKQVVSLDVSQSVDGPSKGVTRYDFRNGSGMEFTVLPDKCLDIPTLRYKGYNLALNGNIVNPALAIPTVRTESARYMGGGMMFTAGLYNAGYPNEDADGEFHPIHGRVSMVPAQNAYTKQGFEDDGRYIMECGGVVVENGFGGRSLQLTRKITTEMGVSELLIEDTLENLSPNPCEYMILYHSNFGWPMLDEGLRCIFPKGKITPRTPQAAEGIADAEKITAPVDGFFEHCYFREADPDENGWATYKIENDKLGIGAYISCDLSTLPILVQWKSMAPGGYALGLEPTNNFINGRKTAKEEGTIPVIEGYGKVKFKVKIGCYDL